MNPTDYIQLSASELVRLISEKNPVPGGGGAAAFAGAVGTALGNMVGSLTVGKTKYANVEENIVYLNEKAKILQADLLGLVGKDAEVFEPLIKAYKNPEDKENLEKCLYAASKVPLEIMKKCCEAIMLLEEYAEKGNRMALSDAGVGAAICVGALKGASLNVFINTNGMANRPLALELNK